MITQGVTGLRERKKAQTRERIYRAAVELAARRGLDAVTVDEIAAEADVSTRTFFNYFPGKDQAIVGIDPETATRFVEAILDAPASMAPLDVLEDVCLRVLLPSIAQAGLKKKRMRLIEENPRLLSAMFDAGRKVDQAAVQAIATRLGLEGTHPYPGLVVTVATSALRSALHAQAVNGSDAEAAVRQAFACIREGLPAPVA